MENLNVDQIIKDLEWLEIAATNMGACTISAAKLKSITDLIGQLTEDVERLTKQCGEIIVECDERDAERLKQVADWKAIAVGYQKQFEDCAEDRARLTEDNKRLHASCTELTRKCASLEADIAKEFTCVFGTSHKVSDCPINDEIAKARAATVKEMAERLERRFKVDIDAIYTGYIIHRYIDQIAKETLEGEL